MIRFHVKNYNWIFVTIHLKIPLVVFFILLLSQVTMAQQKIEHTFQVLQVAGNQIYLEWQEDIPESEWPNVDQRVSMYVEGVYLGDLKIFAVQAPRFVASFEEDIFSVTRGDFLIARWEVELRINPDNDIDSDSSYLEVSADTLKQDSKSILSRGVAERLSQPATNKIIKPSIQGRVLFGSNIFRSSTQWSHITEEQDIRWTSVSYSNLNVRYRDRERGLNMQMSGRHSYRLQTNSTIDQTSITNLYNFFLSKELSNYPITFQLGRFYNSNEFSNPYWDGLKVELSHTSWNFGILSGWEPKRSNEGIQFDWFKTGAFISQRGAYKQLRWSQSVHATSYLPSNGNQHMLIGLDHYLRYKELRIQSEFQWEDQLQEKNWLNSRARIRGGYRFSSWLDLDVYFYNRTPYLIDAIEPVFLADRTRFGFDIKHPLNNWYISYGMSNYDRSGIRTSTYNSRIMWKNSPIWQLDWSLYGSYYTATTGHSVNSGLSISKRVDRSFYSTGFNLYDSKIGLNDQTTGSLFANASIQLKKEFSINFRLQSSYGSLTTRNGVNVSMMKRF